MLLSSFPYEINIELSTACNAKCVICPNRKMKHQRMPESIWRKVIDGCEGHDIQIFFPHIYGEPLLETGLWDVLSYVNKKLPQTHIGLFTNGALLTEEVGRKLLEHNLGFIAFSIDAATPPTYNYMRPGLNYFEVVNNVRNFLVYLHKTNHSEVFTRVQMVVRAENSHEIKFVEKLWQKYVNQVNILGDDGRAIMDGSDGSPAYKCNARWACYTAFQNLYVLPNGDCVVCCKDWLGLTVLGNVMQQSIDEIWYGSTYQYVRYRILQHEYDKVDACDACTNTLSPDRKDGWIS